jgi:hypothetical protein
LLAKQLLTTEYGILYGLLTKIGRKVLSISGQSTTQILKKFRANWLNFAMQRKGTRSCIEWCNNQIIDVFAEAGIMKTGYVNAVGRLLCHRIFMLTSERNIPKKKERPMESVGIKNSIKLNGTNDPQSTGTIINLDFWFLRPRPCGSFLREIKKIIDFCDRTYFFCDKTHLKLA